MNEDYFDRPRPSIGETLVWSGAGLVVALIVVAVFAAFFLRSTAAHAHEAPTGWTYPYACCSGIDCREVTFGPEGLIREHENGYQIATTGEIIARTDGRLKDSPDGQFHWCSIAGSDDTRTICLFVPPAVF